MLQNVKKPLILSISMMFGVLSLQVYCLLWRVVIDYREGSYRQTDQQTAKKIKNS